MRLPVYKMRLSARLAIQSEGVHCLINELFKIGSDPEIKYEVHDYVQRGVYHLTWSRMHLVSGNLRNVLL